VANEPRSHPESLGRGRVVSAEASPPPDGGAGFDWDLLDVYSALTLTATVGNPMTIELFSDSSSGMDFAGSYAWEIMIAPTGITGFNRDAIVLDTDQFYNADDTLFDITVSTSGMELLLLYNAEVAPALPGDTNGDCVVNILDMIGIRNHLNDWATSWPDFDVNNDTFINILDMIYVRNRLNDMCQ